MAKKKFDARGFELSVNGKMVSGMSAADRWARTAPCGNCGSESIFFEASLPIAMLQAKHEGQAARFVMDALTDMLASHSKVPATEASARELAKRINERFDAEGIWVKVPWLIQVCPECGVVLHKRVQELYD